MNVGERITYFRQQKNMTVNKLANTAGISQSYLRDVERGTKQPTVEYLSYICTALGITISQFFDVDEGSEPLARAIRHLTPSQKVQLAQFIEAFYIKE